jgi:hypothetical protein
MNLVSYAPPPTVERFIRDYKPGELFYDWIVGPVGSGKTTGIFFKLLYMAGLQDRSPDGIRRSKAVIVRNTMPQLKDTTIASWRLWFKDGIAGKWKATDNTFILRYGDVECEVLFRALDTPDDVARVLSLEVTFALIDEFVEIPRAIIDALGARVGRYKNPDGTKVTNWGIWGSSNPSTEDNWWYDYLHNNANCVMAQFTDIHAAAAWDALRDKHTTENAMYFHQPSGLSPEAENIANLPGERAYYTNQMKGKGLAWIKQFIEAEWGFSVSGQPMIASFNPVLHIATGALRFNPNRTLVVGLDPGIKASAFVFGQESLSGRLNVLGELIQSGMGAERLIKERLKPYLRQRFPGAMVRIAPDPAAANRSQTDERTIVSVFEKEFDVSYEANNRLPLRIDAIDAYCTALVPEGPAFQIDAVQCPQTTRALKGGWRWAVDAKKGILKGKEAEDNPYTHPGDACGYLARYFHRATLKDLKYRGARFTPPRDFGNGYHFR